MDHFTDAVTVRLRSHHRTYLSVDPDYDDRVKQESNGVPRSVRWSVEPVPNSRGAIRLRSYNGRCLSASDKHSRLPGAGRKIVLVSSAGAGDPSVVWQPVSDGQRVKLRSHLGTFLRANGLFQPYKGSVTHGDPKRTVTQEWVMWEVDVLEMRAPRPGVLVPAQAPVDTDQVRESMTPRGVRPRGGAQRASSTSSVPSIGSGSSLGRGSGSMDYESDSSSSSQEDSPVRTPASSRSGLLRGMSVVERTIHYYVLDDEGEEDPDHPDEIFTFEGSSVQELTRMVERKTGLDDLILCIRDVIHDDKLRKLQLELPPNRRVMTVIAVHASSPVARSFDL